MNSRVLWLIPLLATVLWSGCATARTPEQRIAANRGAYESWPAEVQQHVQAGQVTVGFTPDQVLMALGEPQDRTTRTTADGRSEVWLYRDRSPRLGLGFGVSGGSGGSGVGLGVGTSSGGTREPRLRVVFQGGLVTAVEEARS